MTGTEVHDAWANAAFQAWEEICEEDPCAGKMEEAAKELLHAVEMLRNAIDFMDSAESILYGTDMQETVDELQQECWGLRFGVANLAEKYGRGERE